MKYLKNITIVLLLISSFSSCNKDDNQSFKTFTGKTYFPLRSNNYIIYQMTEIYIDKATAMYDTIHYQIKEIIDTSFIDNSGQKAFRVERYKRADSTQNWIIKDVWVAKVTDYNAQKVEENLRYIKISFPAKQGQTWDGNVYNDLDEQDYQITDINIAETINDLSFDSVLTVEQKSEESLISKIYQVEKFANHVGLIYKEQTDLYSQSLIGSGIPIEQRVDVGTIYKQEVIDYSVTE